MKTDNQNLKDIARKTGSNVSEHRTNNYYLKQINENIGKGGGEGVSYDDSDLKSKIGYNNIPSNTNLQAEIDDITTSLKSIPVKTSDLTNDGDGTNVFVKDNDNRLTDARTPTSHTHNDLVNKTRMLLISPNIVETGGNIDIKAIPIKNNTITVGETVYFYEITNGE